MAQKISVELISDLSGEPGDETVTYGLDGVTYEVDVTSKEAASLREALASYIASSRKVGNTRSGGRKAATRSSNSGYDPKAVRAWAQSHPVKDDKGEVISVPERGRIPGAILDAYRAAGN